MYVHMTSWSVDLLTFSDVRVDFVHLLCSVRLFVCFSAESYQQLEFYVKIVVF